MQLFLDSLPWLLVLAAIVVGFRMILRRPGGVSTEDAPGVRTVVIFDGNATELFADDAPELPFVGVRFFNELCAALAAGGAKIAAKGVENYAQRAECLVDGQGPPVALVMEWLNRQWLLCVEYIPQGGAERRHIAMTKQMFVPANTPALRKFLLQVDACLKADPRLRNVRWLRKQDWLREQTDQTHPTPVDGGTDRVAAP